MGIPVIPHLAGLIPVLISISITAKVGWGICVCVRVRGGLTRVYEIRLFTLDQYYHCRAEKLVSRED